MRKLSILATVAAIAIAAPAQAATYVVFDDFDGGIANFDSTVTGTGTSVSTLSLTPGSNGVYTDFTITRASGAGVTVGSPYSLYAASPSRQTSGGVIDISPSGTGPGIGAKGSGIKFTFTDPVNALGFEVGDWATCCQPSDLYIQFGASTPILVGESDAFGDQFLTNNGAGVFVGAFDNTGSFNEVTFWGDGFGEYLVAGGTIRYADVGVGTQLPGGGGVPEPATWAMMIIGFGAVGATMRRRQKVAVTYA